MAAETKPAAATAAANPIVSGVVTDLDGTLIDYEGASHAALEEPLVELGIVDEFSWELHADIVGRKPVGLDALEGSSLK